MNKGHRENGNAQPDWVRLAPQEVAAMLQTDLDAGLGNLEARRRLKIYGPNALQEAERQPAWKRLLYQFRDFMVVILLVAAMISALIGEVVDALTILAIVFANAVLGFIQENKAERSLEALRRLSAPEAVVHRDGCSQRLPAAELAPGDLVFLNPGDKVAADLRLITASGLEVDESLLTGESIPVKKEAAFQPPDAAKALAVAERKNILFSSTIVTRGHGKGVVVATGMQAEVGKIAGMLQEVRETTTPLQRRLGQLGRWLVLASILICALVALVGVLRGEEVVTMFLTGVSLAVAAIPEGLPAVVTIALALGVSRMVRRHAIVRRLPAVETLGCATVICSDKTGTLTKNEMTVTEVFCGGSLLEVTGEGYEPQGRFQMFGKTLYMPLQEEVGQDNLLDGKAREVGAVLPLLLKSVVACNNSSLQHKPYPLKNRPKNQRSDGVREGKGSDWSVEGDPTEGALLVLAGKGGIWAESVEREEPRLDEFSFDSERKRMSVICRQGEGGLRLYLKGAPDIVLARCTSAFQAEGNVRLTEVQRNSILSLNQDMAKRALRVLAVAYRNLPPDLDPGNQEDLERELVFLGLVGMVDPPRPATVKAVGICRRAGIRPVMVTGDHQATAEAIASQIGILRSGDTVLTGTELDRITDKELAALVETVSVFARVSPGHKLRIVRALKARGHVVAMTGDGVNDAPAVKEADIGLAMGRTGTDVTKEASAIILTDDNFATIVAAVEEGRAIYENIRKFVRYLLACNTGEVLTMLLASLAGLSLPLLPTQILWVNLVTDGLPAVALGLEPAAPNLMQRPPRQPRESIFAHGLLGRVLGQGLWIGVGTLAVFALMLWLDNTNLALARTMAFTTLVMFQLFYVFECRSETGSGWGKGISSNPVLVLACFSSVVLQLLVIYLPVFNTIFQTTPLNFYHWLVILTVAGGKALVNSLLSAATALFNRHSVVVRV